MISNIYSIFDSGSETFQPLLIIERSDKLAVRKAQDMYNFGEHCIKEGRTGDMYAKYVQYPTCFALVRLGTIDDETGQLTPLDIKQEVINFTMFTSETKDNMQKAYNQVGEQALKDWTEKNLSETPTN